MKCGIVTVYNSENAGSFLQAMALQKALQSMGHDAVCVYQSFSDHSASYRNFCRRFVAAVIKRGPLAAKRVVEQRYLFKQAQRNLNIEKDRQSIDCLVLGSDVIWDVKQKFFNNHKAFFWGTEFVGAKVIAYASSVGFAQEEDLACCGHIRDALRNMLSVSVRDVTSYRLIQPYCDKKVHIVCDPTILVDREVYDNLEKPSELENFIFLYFYGKMPMDYVVEIQNFAKARGLKTVIFGNGNDWCDISLAYDPLLFLTLYRKADYIITNTFHGTVFANIYEKKYVVIRNDTPKILDFWICVRCRIK